MAQDAHFQLLHLHPTRQAPSNALVEAFRPSHRHSFPNRRLSLHPILYLSFLSSTPLIIRFSLRKLVPSWLSHFVSLSLYHFVDGLLHAR